MGKRTRKKEKIQKIRNGEIIRKIKEIESILKHSGLYSCTIRNLPQKINILGFPYRVLWQKKLPDPIKERLSGDVIGTYDLGTRSIFIVDQKNDFMNLLIFFHEIMHVISDYCRIKLVEKDIYTLSSSIFAIVIQIIPHLYKVFFSPLLIPANSRKLKRKAELKGRN